MLSGQEASHKKLFKNQIVFTFFSLYYARLITSLAVFCSIVRIQMYTKRRDIFILTTDDNNLCLCINLLVVHIFIIITFYLFSLTI